MPLLGLLLLAAVDPVRLVVPPLIGSGADASGASEQLIQELTSRGFVLLRESELTALSEEQQRTLVGCAEDRCAAELAIALRADGTLIGGVAGTDQARMINLRVVGPTGVVLATASMSATTPGAVPDAVHVLVRELVTQLRAKVDPERIPPEEGRLKKTHALGPSITAGLLGGLGVLLVQLAQGTQARISQDMPPFSNAMERDRAISNARTLEVSGWTCIGVGLALLAVSIVVLIAGDPP